jgi:hypothetical protein
MDRVTDEIIVLQDCLIKVACSFLSFIVLWGRDRLSRSYRAHVCNSEEASSYVQRPQLLISELSVVAWFLAQGLHGKLHMHTFRQAAEHSRYTTA